MFESAELGHEIDDETYEREEPALREQLIETQLQVVEEKRFPVIVLISGVDGAGKGETVNLLNEWMDPRHVRTWAMDPPTDEERARPPMWKFWRILPPKGRIGIFFGSWYTEPIIGRVYGERKKKQFEADLSEITRFEKMLTDEGALIVKLWFHLSKKKQRKILEKLQSDPATSWRVSDTDWKHHQCYDQFRKVSEHALQVTSTPNAPWVVVEGLDANYRNLTVGKLLLQAMQQRLAQPPKPKSKSNGNAPIHSPIDCKDVLGELDLSQTLDKEIYKKELAKLQGRLNAISRHPRFQSRSAVVAFEGNDAAGKGGAIRRVTSALDARRVDVIPIAAPTDEERAQPYLWRFWRHIPKRGELAIFDRTWYGRVLVERVEGFCSADDWMRAYSEINDFEETLVTHGITVVKFWLSISKEEQARRFKARAETGHKRFKITDEDWRNRKKWDDYAKAVCDMVDRTSTKLAPWQLVEANDKYFARIKILRTICERLEASL